MGQEKVAPDRVAWWHVHPEAEHSATSIMRRRSSDLHGARGPMIRWPMIPRSSIMRRRSSDLHGARGCMLIVFSLLRSPGPGTVHIFGESVVPAVAKSNQCCNGSSRYSQPCFKHNGLSATAMQSSQFCLSVCPGARGLGGWDLREAVGNCRAFIVQDGRAYIYIYRERERERETNYINESGWNRISAGRIAHPRSI